MTASKAEIRRQRFEGRDLKRTVTYATGNYCRTDYRSPSVLTMTLTLIRPLLISLKHNQVCRFGELLSGQEFLSKNWTHLVKGRLGSTNWCSEFSLSNSFLTVKTNYRASLIRINQLVNLSDRVQRCAKLSLSRLLFNKSFCKHRISWVREGHKRAQTKTPFLANTHEFVTKTSS